jgi:hypothetical protein
MAAKPKPDPNEILHLQVRPGETVRYKDIAYGDRATLQVPRWDLGRVDGPYDEIDPAQVPDVAGLPPAA